MSWWEQRTLPLAVALETSSGPVLITHAGLTFGFWRDLGSPDCAQVAAILNAMVGTDVVRAFRAGMIVTGAVDVAAGPCWAETSSELLEPWLSYADHGGRIPFSQIHGHASVVADWDSAALWPHTPPAVAQTVEIDRLRRRYRLAVGGRYFTGVDWIMLAEPPVLLPPMLELEAAGLPSWGG